MQSNRCNTGTLSSFTRLNEGEVVSVNAFTHLDGEGNVTSSFDGFFDNLSKEILLPWQCRTATLAGDLGHRTTKVQVDVVSAVLCHQHGDGFTHRLGCHTVKLNGAHFFTGVGLDQVHGTRCSLDECT